MTTYTDIEVVELHEHNNMFQWVQTDVATGQSEVVEYYETLADCLSDVELLWRTETSLHGKFTNFVQCNGNLCATIVNADVVIMADGSVVKL